MGTPGTPWALTRAAEFPDSGRIDAETRSPDEMTATAWAERGYLTLVPDLSATSDVGDVDPLDRAGERERGAVAVVEGDGRAEVDPDVEGLRRGEHRLDRSLDTT